MTTQYEKLDDAFKRLKEGKPIRVNASRKISPTSVEDEAGVARSTLRNTEIYKKLFDEIVDYKNTNQKLTTKGSNSKLTSIDPNEKALREKLNKTKQKLRELEEKYDKLLACNAELTQVILDQRFAEHMSKISTDSVDNVVSIYKDECADQ